MPADLHTHSEASSDSTLSVEDRVKLARENGITTVGMTDHMAVHESLSDREQTVGGVTLVAGAELNCTVDGSRVDILGLFVDPERMRQRVGATTTSGVTVEDGVELSPADVISWIHDAGGVAVLAHPGRYDLDLAELVDSLVDAGLDGIETEYPYDVSPPDSPKTPPPEIRDIARRNGLLDSGGSDCHGPDYNDGPFIGAIELGDGDVAELRQASEASR